MQTRIGILFLCGFSFWWWFKVAIALDWTNDPDEARSSRENADYTAGYEWGYVHAVPMLFGLGMAVANWQAVKHLRDRQWFRVHPFLAVACVVLGTLVLTVIVTAMSFYWPE